MDKDRQKNRRHSLPQALPGPASNRPPLEEETFHPGGHIYPQCLTEPGATPTCACEILTVEQLAERLQVCRATIFNLMQREILLPGVHYFKLGRITRFPWTPQLITSFLEMSAAKKIQPPVVKPATNLIRRKNSNPINWEY